MPNYKWEGVDKNGKKANGKIDARNEKDARKLLRGQGVRAKKVSPPSIFEMNLGEWMVENNLVAAFGHAELGNFTKQLAIMVNAGVPILQGLEILYKAEANPSLKSAIKKISVAVGEGKTLAEAMGAQKGFDKLYCNLVKAGEAGGILDEILKKLSEHMEKQEKTKGQIKSAMMYPAIVVLVGIGVITGMMVFVVPQMTDMITSSGQELPAITAFVVNTSKFMAENILLILFGFVGSFLGGMAYLKTPAGKITYDRVMMKMPVFGMIIIKGNLNSFARTLATMLGAGVALVDSLDICIETIDNSVIANDIKKVKAAVVNGKTLTEPLGQIPYFPDMVAQMIKVGEQTGEIDMMLVKISEVFESQVNDLVSNMTKLIEPFILVVLGGIVAVILIAMYLPVFQSAGGV